jgi:hypothetical protein
LLPPLRYPHNTMNLFSFEKHQSRPRPRAHARQRPRLRSRIRPPARKCKSALNKELLILPYGQLDTYVLRRRWVRGLPAPHIQEHAKFQIYLVGCLWTREYARPLKAICLHAEKCVRVSVVVVVRVLVDVAGLYSREIEQIYPDPYKQGKNEGGIRRDASGLPPLGQSGRI